MVGVRHGDCSSLMLCDSLYHVCGQLIGRGRASGSVNDCQEDNWTARMTAPSPSPRATARAARTIPTCPCYTSPCIVRATLAVALVIIHRPCFSFLYALTIL